MWSFTGHGDLVHPLAEKTHMGDCYFWKEIRFTGQEVSIDWSMAAVHMALRI